MANLRLLYLYTWTHPGKKLLFMGNEFGQSSEWYCKASLDWHLTEEEEGHHNLLEFVRNLNNLYKENKALWELDFSSDGFSWLDFNDVDNSIVAYARKAKNSEDHLVCLLNFTPHVIHDYKVGVPEHVNYREIMTSDDTKYGGSGISNTDEKAVFKEPHGNAPYHVQVSIPPLGGLILEPVR
jgi:1,4-alpha-glucan branching enzyme